MRDVLVVIAAALVIVAFVLLFVLAGRELDQARGIL